MSKMHDGSLDYRSHWSTTDNDDRYRCQRCGCSSRDAGPAGFDQDGRCATCAKNYSNPAHGKCCSCGRQGQHSSPLCSNGLCTVCEAERYEKEVSKRAASLKKKYQESKKEEKNMSAPSASSKKSSVVGLIDNPLEEAKSIVEAAAWQTAADVTVDAFREPLIASVMSHPNRSPKAEMFCEFLRSPEGEAALAAFLGTAHWVIPALRSDPRIVRVSKEMQTKGAKFATDKIVKDLSGPIIAAFTKAVASLPPLPGTGA